VTLSNSATGTYNVSASKISNAAASPTPAPSTSPPAPTSSAWRLPRRQYQRQLRRHRSFHQRLFRLRRFQARRPRTFELTSGTLTLSGSLGAPTFNQSGGTLTGTHTFASGNTFNWSDGNWSNSGSDTATIASGATLNVTNSGSNHTFGGVAVVNNGTVNWSAGSLVASGGATFTNNATFNDTSTSGFGGTGTGGANMTFTNAATGTCNVSVSKNSNVAFTNAGTFNLTAGTYQFTSGGSSTGTINASSGTTVNFTSDYTLANGTSLLGLGAYQLLSGTLTASGTVTLTNFALSAGTLTGTHTINGSATSTSTNLNTAGTTTIGATGNLTISGGNDHDFDTRAIVNNGTGQLDRRPPPLRQLWHHH